MKDWKGNCASTFKTIGASNHVDHERGDADYYATEPAATEWLCKIEQFKSPILEPSCGEGHISEVLKAHGLSERKDFKGIPKFGGSTENKRDYLRGN